MLLEQIILLLGDLHDKAVALDFKVRLEVVDDVDQELVLKTFKGHREVDNSCLDACFRQEMWVRKLARHQEAERWVVDKRFVAEVNLVHAIFLEQSLRQD